MTTITLTNSETGWNATWSGDLAPKIQAQFGTTTIPIGFTATADVSVVITSIQRLNPDCIVVEGKATRQCTTLLKLGRDLIQCSRPATTGFRWMSEDSSVCCSECRTNMQAGAVRLRKTLLFWPLEDPTR